MKLSLYCLLFTLFYSQFSGCTILEALPDNVEIVTKESKPAKRKIDQITIKTPKEVQYFDNSSRDRSSENDLLQNPSFEEINHEKRSDPTILQLHNWSDLGKFDNQSPPTLFTTKHTMFNVSDFPSDGNQYVGFVVRENGSYGEMYQFLNNRLEQDASYEFEIDINYSSKMMSPFPEIPQSKFYGNNAKLIIKVANSITGENYEISQLIPNYSEQWETNKVTFISPCNCDVFILGAYYIGIITDDYYNGNIMIDNLSNIIKLEKD